MTEPFGKVTVEQLRALRMGLREKLEPYVDRSSCFYSKQKMAIIIDSIIYFSFVYATELNGMKKNGRTNTIDFCVKQMTKNGTSSLFNDSIKDHVTFPNVIKKLTEYLGFKKRPEIYPEKFFNEERIKNPEIRLAVQLYLNKGKFVWVPASRSMFKKFVYSETQESLPDGAKINCWEAILYAMLKAKMFSRDLLKDYYEYGIHLRLNHLEKWFGFNKANPILNQKEAPLVGTKNETTKALLIMYSSRDWSGMEHNMVMVPFSQKQILKMLIEKQFNEEPQKHKIYSHWTLWTDGTLGTVNKGVFREIVGLSKHHMRTRSISDLARRGEEYRLNQ